MTEANLLDIDFDQNLARNLALINQRWPSVGRAIALSEPPPLELLTRTQDGVLEFTAKVSGLQLSSVYGRHVDVMSQVAHLPMRTSLVTVFGLALGDLARAVCSDPGAEGVRVVIMNPAIAQIGLCLGDQTDWLKRERLELLMGNQLQKPEGDFVVVPPALQLADDGCLSLRDEVTAALQLEYVDANRTGQDDVLDAHVAANEELVAGDGDVASLFDCALGEDVIVVGPGPTLGRQMEQLKHRSSNATLIVISTALAPVLDAGLVPDAVVMIDPFSTDPLGKASASQRASMIQVPLVYVPCVQQPTLEAWPGPRLVAYLRRPYLAAIKARHTRAELWTSGTVAHSAADLAVKMGASGVFFFGLDFSYPGGLSHVPGTVHSAARTGGDQGRTIPNGFGERVASDPNLIMYLRDLEGFVKLFPKVRFWRADKRSAAMEGVAWLPE